MSWRVWLLPLVLLSSCRDPYVIDAKGVEIGETANKYNESSYHESYDDSVADDYLEKPMVSEVDVAGVETTNPQDNDRFWYDLPDHYDRSLFRSPAAATTSEFEVDSESADERHDFDAP